MPAFEIHTAAGGTPLKEKPSDATKDLWGLMGPSPGQNALDFNLSLGSAPRGGVKAYRSGDEAAEA